MDPVYIYINGYPGIGKYAIAKELQKLIPNSKIYQNEWLLDPLEPLKRKEMEHRDRRILLRRDILAIIPTSKETRNNTWIFTDTRCNNITDTIAATDYRDAAYLREAGFISVILTCDLEENVTRVLAEQREINNGEIPEPNTNIKLHNLILLHMLEEDQELYKFHDECDLELEIDTTGMTPLAVAREISEKVAKLAADTAEGTTQ